MLIAAGLIGINVGASSEAPRGTEIGVCAIARDPAKYDHQLLTVRAQLQSDGRHGAQIFEEPCGEFGVGLIFPGKVKGKRQFDKAIDWGSQGTKDKIIFGTFTGVVQVNPEGHPPRTMTVQKIQKITVASK